MPWDRSARERRVAALAGLGEAGVGWRLSGIGWGIGAVLAAAGAAAGALLIRSRALREVGQPS